MNQHTYSFNNFKTNKQSDVQQILFSQYSLALDCVPKQEVIQLKTLGSVRLKAVLQKHKLIKVVVDFSQKDLSSLAEIKGAQTEGGMKLYRMQVNGGSSLVLGTYGDKEGTVCFMSFHLLYVDMLM